MIAMIGGLGTGIFGVEETQQHSPRFHHALDTLDQWLYQRFGQIVGNAAASTPLSGGRAHTQFAAGFSRLRLSVFLKINCSFEVSSIFDGDTLGGDSADQIRRFLQLTFFISLDVTFDFAVQNNLARTNISAYAAMRPHGKAVLLQVNAAFNLAVEIEVFAS